MQFHHGDPASLHREDATPPQAAGRAEESAPEGLVAGAARVAGPAVTGPGAGQRVVRR